MVIITLVYIADELSTQLNGQMQEVIADQLFGSFEGNALGTLTTLTTVFTAAGAFISLFYKPLSDRYGRKLFLFVNALGMGVGTLIVGLATNIPVYLVGTLFVFFFIPNDIQQVYIMEAAPAKYRATTYSVIKCAATLGMLAIPLLRKTVMPTNADFGNVYLIIAGIAAAAGLLALLFVREPDLYVKERLAYLNLSDEERAAKKEAEKEAAAQGGIVPALKFCIKHKQMLWVIITSGLIGAGMIITSYYNASMSLGYELHFAAAGAEDVKVAVKGAIDNALLLFPIGSAFIQLIQGFISDKVGRKPATAVLAVSCIISYVLFFVGCNNAWNPYVVGLFCGMAIGAYWSTGDIYAIITSESCPTNLRSSIMGVRPTLSTIIGGIPFVIGMAVILFTNDSVIPTVCMCIAVPFMALGLIFTMLKVHETKGVDLDKVTGAEWDKKPPVCEDATNEEKTEEEINKAEE